jgi:nucleotide-binding universal stress UspA family protein
MNGKRILVPVNLERNSFDSLEFVAALAREMPVCATLLHVVEVNIFALDSRLYDGLCHESERRLRTIAKTFFGNEMPDIQVRVGRPHEQILAETEAAQPELIVLASSKSGRRKWRLLPTTVERVVRNAPCLTLVLPRTWKISPEQFRQAMRSSATATRNHEFACQ